MTEEFPTALARNIRHLIAARDDIPSIRALERRAGLRYGTVKAMLQGRSTNPRIGNIRKLAAALDTTPEALMGAGGDGPVESSMPFPHVRVAKVMVVSEVNAGWYRRPEDILKYKKYEVFVPNTALIGGGMWYGLEIKDETMAEIYPPSTVVIVEALGETTAIPGRGERVIVETWQGGLVDVACRIATRAAGVLHLSDAPAGGGAATIAAGDAAAGEPAVADPAPKPDGIYVVAIVGGSYRPEPRRAGNAED